MVHFAVKGTPLKPQTAPKTGHHQLAKDTLLQIPFRTLVRGLKLTEAGAYPQLPTQPFFFDYFQTSTAI
jgi:hypothetical protein